MTQPALRPVRVAFACLCLLASGLLVGCGSTKVPAATPAPTTAALPSGWKRFSFGVMSVGAPSSWTVRRSAPLSCGPPPADTVTEEPFSKIVAISCPALPLQPPVAAVSIECLVGPSAAPYQPSSATSDSAGLVHEDDEVYRRLGTTVGLVTVPGFGPVSDLAGEILAAVRPASGAC